MQYSCPSVTSLFDLLDQWRHHPAYQLERRADIFFAMYLREVIEQELGVSLHEHIVPEFPIKHEHNNQSGKVDYLLAARDHSEVFFVELKTDARSRREAQDEYLGRARGLGFARISRDLVQIMLNTTEHEKYEHLARSMVRLGFGTYVWRVLPR